MSLVLFGYFRLKFVLRLHLEWNYLKKYVVKKTNYSESWSKKITIIIFFQLILRDFPRSCSFDWRIFQFIKAASTHASVKFLSHTCSYCKNERFYGVPKFQFYGHRDHNINFRIVPSEWARNIFCVKIIFKSCTIISISKRPLSHLVINCRLLLARAYLFFLSAAAVHQMENDWDYYKMNLKWISETSVMNF